MILPLDAVVSGGRSRIRAQLIKIE